MNVVSFQQNYEGAYVMASGRNFVLSSVTIITNPQTINSGITNPDTFPQSVGKLLAVKFDSIALANYGVVSNLTANGLKGKIVISIASATGFSANDPVFIYSFPQTTTTAEVFIGATTIPVTDTEPFNISLYETFQEIGGSNFFLSADDFAYTGISVVSGAGNLTGVTGISGYGTDVMDAITGWAGTGITVTLDTTNKAEGTGCLSCLIDGTGNRKLTKTVALNFTNSTTIRGYNRCATAASTGQFYITDNLGNISYWNFTTGGANVWTEQSYTIASPDGNDGTPADTTNIVAWGYRALQASKTYKFDRLYASHKSGATVQGSKGHTQDFTIKSIAGNDITLFEELLRNFCKGGDVPARLIKCPTIVINGTTDEGVTAETIYVNKHNSSFFTKNHWLTVTSIVVSGLTGGNIQVFEAIDMQLIAAYSNDPTIYGDATTGPITGINATPTAGGTGYAVNDILTITTGGGNATVIVTSVSSGVVTGLRVLASGTGYSTGIAQATTYGGAGTACTVNVQAVQKVRQLRVVKPIWQGDNDLKLNASNLGATSYTRNAATWTASAYNTLGYKVLLVGQNQTSSNTERIISSNTAAVLTISASWTAGTNKFGAIIYDAKMATANTGMVALNGMWDDISPGSRGSMLLTFVVAGYTGIPFVGASLTINGRDGQGANQSETVTITGNGSFVTTKYFSSIFQVDLPKTFKDSIMPTITGGITSAGTWGADDGTVKIQQPIWGLFKKVSDTYSNSPNTALHLGWDGAIRQACSVILSDNALISHERYRNFNIGTMTAMKRWRDCDFQTGYKLGNHIERGANLKFISVISQDDNTNALAIDKENQGGGIAFFYGSSFICEFWDNIGATCEVNPKFSMGAENLEVFECYFENWQDVAFSNRAASQTNNSKNFTLNLARITFQDAVLSGLSFLGIENELTLNNTKIHRYSAYGAFYAIVPAQIYNAKVDGAMLISGGKVYVYAFAFSSGSSKPFNLYDCFEILSIYNVYFDGFGGGLQMVDTYRSFTLQTEPNATVIIKDAQNNTYTFTADSAGIIWMQWVKTTRCQWDASPVSPFDSTLTNYYPFTLTIKKDGYRTYKETLNVPIMQGIGWRLEQYLKGNPYIPVQLGVKEAMIV